MRAAKLALLPFEAVVLRCMCTLEGFIMLLGEAVEWKDETCVAGSNPRPKIKLSQSSFRGLGSEPTTFSFRIFST